MFVLLQVNAYMQELEEEERQKMTEQDDYARSFWCLGMCRHFICLIADITTNRHDPAPDHNVDGVSFCEWVGQGAKNGRQTKIMIYHDVLRTGSRRSGLWPRHHKISQVKLSRCPELQQPKIESREVKWTFGHYWTLSCTNIAICYNKVRCHLKIGRRAWPIRPIFHCVKGKCSGSKLRKMDRHGSNLI